MQKDLSKNYFVFTKKEKRGTLVILAVIFLVFMSGKYIYPLLLKKDTESASDISVLADSLKAKEAIQKYIPNEYPGENQNDHRYPGSYPERNASRGELFYFDPNTLDAAGWQKLGVREKTAQTILNYISKGGKFREPGDISKIWGLREEEKQRLIPYVRISMQERSSGSYPAYQHYEKKAYEKKAADPVDINSGDSVSFVSLPGIGPGFSKRILSFRDKLGGFYKIEQVSETFGLPDSVYQKIKPLLKISATDVRKININTASNDELKAHPYIRWQLANVITEFKKQHGDFKTLADLKKIMLIDEATYQKIMPYLTL
jgi:competence protein ComEA